MDKIYYQPNHLWRGQKAVKKLAELSGEKPNSGDLRQGSSNNSVTNFVLGFSYIFQRETQPSSEDLLLVVLVILKRRFVTRF